jgi:hypothetical protein
MNKNLLCKHFFYRNKFDEINSVKQGNEYITFRNKLKIYSNIPELFFDA